MVSKYELHLTCQCEGHLEIVTEAVYSDTENRVWLDAKAKEFYDNHRGDDCSGLGSEDPEDEEVFETSLRPFAHREPTKYVVEKEDPMEPENYGLGDEPGEQVETVKELTVKEKAQAFERANTPRKSNQEK